jgi:hypothetical protein
MNPNYLLREEIEYELCVRGLNVMGDINLLRQVFRSVVTETVAVNLENLGGEFDPQEHIEYISSKIQELEVLLEKSAELAAMCPTFSWSPNNVVELEYAASEYLRFSTQGTDCAPRSY